MFAFWPVPMLGPVCLLGPVNMSTSAQLVAPAVVVKGTLSITASELYFEVDEDEASFKTIDPKVREGLYLPLIQSRPSRHSVKSAFKMAQAFLPVLP